jgi:hypothetical protein
MGRYKTFKRSTLSSWGWKPQGVMLCRKQFRSSLQPQSTRSSFKFSTISLSCFGKSRETPEHLSTMAEARGELSNKIPGQPHQDTVVGRRHFRKHGVHILLLLPLKTLLTTIPRSSLLLQSAPAGEKLSSPGNFERCHDRESKLFLRLFLSWQIPERNIPQLNKTMSALYTSRLTNSTWF